MTQKSRRLIPVLLLFPGSAFALGLGEVKLNSALNQPLNAEIALVAAAPDEVESLRASLASRETFARYGLDRPAFLSNLSLKAGKSASGEPVIVLRSNEAITEPFVTVLVEVSWNRGRLLREYTLLLDPPVFRDAAPAAAPVVAPRSGSAAGAVARPSTQPADTPVAAPTDTALGGEYRVRPNDSLSRIARAAGATGRGEIDRTMVAIFRSNPNAFYGNNINRLRSGAILRMPGADEVAAVSASEASALVREQVAEWRSSAAAAGAAGADEPGRLRLVAPTDGSGGAGTAPADPALQGRVRALEGELAEARRLLELKNAELARLQGKAQPPAEAPAPVTPPAAEAPPAAEPAPATPVAEEPAPAKEPAAAPAKKPRKPAKKPAAEEEAGLLDSLGGTTGLVLGGALLLLAGGLGYGYLRRRREAAEDEFDAPRTGGMDGGNYGTGVFARPDVDPSASMVVVEDDGSGEFVPPPLVPPPLPSAAQAPARNPEDTLSGETAIDLDKGDALSEADFHMAYGLYDQAADIVKLALQREPGRRDLKMKLLEVYFVWGKGDAFTEVARELARSRDEAVPGEWDKVVIMGKQVAPQDPLFAGAGTSAAGQSVDLNLEGGQGHVDLELLDGTVPGTQDAAGRGDDLVDFDLSSALGADDSAATGERPGLSGSGLDFVLDEPGRGAEGLASTAEQALGQNAATMEQWRGDSPTVEQPVLRGSESPTMESPMLSAAPDSTMRERVDQAILAQRRDDDRADQTAEMSLDDLNLDLGDADQSLDSSFVDLSPLETTGQPVSIDGLSDDAATMLSGMDQRSRTLMQKAGLASGADATERVPGLDGSSDTAQLRALVPEMSALGGRVDDEYSLDMDLDALTRVGGGLDPAEVKTVETSSDGIDDLRFSDDVFNGGAGGKLDLDVGSETRVSRTLTERISAEGLSLPELEPVTLSEVGTKLDLARAYMDMGDPDGARSILQEVLAEGSASQKQEAGRLLESLPG